MSNKVAIIIPARYASTRLPGKPLVKILGKEMLLHVWEIANSIQINNDYVKAFVATDDERIRVFCLQNSINCIMTSETCNTGTERVAEAVEKISHNGFTPEFIINLQGDNPLCPTWFLQELINEFNRNESIEIATTVVNLTWEDLDTMRDNKVSTPFSGTCVVFDANRNAMYFSKNIIPAIRKEENVRLKSSYSPVYRQPGLYGYSLKSLRKIKILTDGFYEKYEGLEQLNFLENGLKIKCVEVDYKDFNKLNSISGIDSPEDVVRAENILKEYKKIY
ncbi:MULTISPECIES: 3-deoxy-manno-octulosonate cytidylyltransferase [unclassified Oceanispirochaeta]|uniref:3-deoxy-manno-octulosonate cytidylyltransferase n=1 Tax=unclassified Oceanispirochaeta TaxID=2635722 RepID=UPI000E08DCD2|nr:MULTISPECIES: manno-octulosonate cytidylyltransferase [unclassified Oceanispirochaeta]MBF9014414.1 3-deoxy-manno-octulosonate cytidylyltransferase [Oceanispirochaeta sp. M2]NPD71300.1 3-deoxy-manno-octulosonate cytidylyltransferase [Oceanispirochaeta sp. M1]RDG33681.1 3-deoxy-manno-octulosonate cytidylyltransferase [Oceanispirochaeta sp. M1]